MAASVTLKAIIYSLCEAQSTWCRPLLVISLALNIALLCHVKNLTLFSLAINIGSKNQFGVPRVDIKFQPPIMTPRVLVDILVSPATVYSPMGPIGSIGSRG